MEFTARDIAEHIGGVISGNPDVKVSSVAKIEQGKSGNICFLANPKYEHYLYVCKASVILLNNSFEIKGEITPTVIRVDNAYEALATVMELFSSSKRRKGFSFFSRIAFSAKVSRSSYVGAYTVIERKARVGKNCQIYPQVYIGENVEIGDNVTIYQGAKIYKGCKIGNDCIIHANAVIGADGFGFAPREDGTYKKIPQNGIVIIKDNCEIGANTTIDRAAIGATVIEQGVKIDNLVQIAHNVTVGENTVIAAQSGIAGSSQIGKNCMFGGQVGIVGHIKVADRTIIAAQSGISGNVREPGKTLMGSPAFNHRDYIKAYSFFKNFAKKD